MQFLAAITFFVLLNIIVRLPNNIKISSKDYIETIGTVYAYKKEHFANSYQFSMIVHYTINGNTYELVEDFSSSIPFRLVGSKVRLKYHKKDVLDDYIVYNLKVYDILLILFSIQIFYLMFNK